VSGGIAPCIHNLGRIQTTALMATLLPHVCFRDELKHFSITAYATEECAVNTRHEINDADC
jgi:hypothetical protein